MIHSTLKYFFIVSDFKYQRIKANANISNRLDCIDGKIFYFHMSHYDIWFIKLRLKNSAHRVLFIQLSLSSD